jgi:hypothetical protein
MTRAFLYLAAFTLLAGCAPAPTVADSYPLRRNVLPETPYRECVEVVPGEVLSVEFASARELDFSLERLAGTEYRNTVTRKACNRYTGFFTAPSTTYYCLSWRNSGSDRPVALGFDYEILK